MAVLLPNRLRLSLRGSVGYRFVADHQERKVLDLCRPSPPVQQEKRIADQKASDEACRCPGAEACLEGNRVDGEEQGEHPVEARGDYGDVEKEDRVEAADHVEVVGEVKESSVTFLPQLVARSLLLLVDPLALSPPSV
jgi:hypothetical protein